MGYLTVCIDLNALRYNLELVRGRLGGRTRLLLMLKADAYGHGALEIAKASEGYADWFGAATAGEGANIRRVTNKPVLVTAFEALDAPLAARYKLTPVIYNKAQADALERAAEDANAFISVHIKLDTGMNRLGIKDSGIYIDFLNYISGLKRVCVSGVCTHFYDNDPAVMLRQKALFDAIIEHSPKLITHCGSSGSLLANGAYGADLARIGIAAYGYLPGLTGLQPVMSVLSKVLAVKPVTAGETAGYSGIYKVTRNTELAVIRGGYYDGISRAMAGGAVIIRGKACPIAAVCMDMCIIDAGGAEAKPGDTAVIMGCSGKVNNTAEEIAAHAKTITYEILTGFKGRIERVYYD